MAGDGAVSLGHPAGPSAITRGFRRDGARREMLPTEAGGGSAGAPEAGEAKAESPEPPEEPTHRGFRLRGLVLDLRATERQGHCDDR